MSVKRLSALSLTQQMYSETDSSFLENPWKKSDFPGPVWNVLTNINDFVTCMYICSEYVVDDSDISDIKTSDGNIWRVNELAKQTSEQLMYGSWWRHQMETFSAPLSLCEGESTGHRWIPLTKASDAELWCFSLISAWTHRWANN